MNTFSTKHLSAISGLLLALAFLGILLPQSRAEDPPPAPEALLDRMTGEWVMTGTIRDKPVTHDVHVDWILKRQYLRIHEVSRETAADGSLAYEAWIHVVWNDDKGEYAVMWLDSTGKTDFAAEGVGHAKPDGDRIPFVWNSADGSGIRNTFAYDRANDRWSWAIDNVESSGTKESFARLTLDRK